jgi:LysR family transcriptional regulator, glycine cleavage system transcriptional activator
MLTVRRHLPAIQLLISFEATARNLSFSQTAQELSLTQGAVSRHIKALEEQLGAKLFLRSGKNISLTEAGHTYLPPIRDALKSIAFASLNLSTNPLGGTFNLAILPTFGTRWLAPRLPAFLSAHAGITVNLTTRLEPFDFGEEDLHAAIHYGGRKWAGADMDFLMDETVIPACSPDYKAAHISQTPELSKDITLLHLDSRPNAWPNWVSQYDTNFPQHRHDLVFDQFAMASNAVRSGAGIALLPSFLIDTELSDGSIVPAFDLPMTSSEAYYLVWPRIYEKFPPLRLFRRWLQSEIKQAFDTFTAP